MLVKCDYSCLFDAWQCIDVGCTCFTQAMNTKSERRKIARSKLKIFIE